jgi:hypothetical protein
MAFDEFMHKPLNEYDLFTKLSKHISENFGALHGKHFYFHLSVAGDHNSMIDEVMQFADLYEFGQHLYVDRDYEACIVMRSDQNSIGLLLMGEFEFAEHKVENSHVAVAFERQESNLPSRRLSGFSSVDVMKAFGQIKESLQESKRNIAS